MRANRAVCALGWLSVLFHHTLCSQSVRMWTALILTIGFGASASAQHGYFKGLGDLPGGNFGSVAEAVSADGSVVVGRSFSAKGDEAFRWTKETGMVGLGDLLGGLFFSEADAVSANGSVVVGGGVSAKGSEGFRWTAKTGIVGVGGLPGGQFWSSVNDLSADGSVMVGFSESAKDVEAFRWTEKTGMVGLGYLRRSLFEWGKVCESVAYAVSADGSVVVGYCQCGDDAFVVGGNQMMIIGDKQAFIWHESIGMRSVADWLKSYGVRVPRGWQLEVATDVVVNGSQVTVVGWGRNPAGEAEAWIAEAPMPKGLSPSAQIFLSVCPLLVVVGATVWLLRRGRRASERV